MDSVRNPYTPGAGAKPTALVGRDEQLAAIDVALQRVLAGHHEKSMLLTGLRGVGKTVLLKAFRDQASDHGFITQHAEADESTTLVQAVAFMARRSLLELSAVERLKDRVGRSLGILKSLTISAGGVDLRLETDPVAGLGDSGNLGADLADVLISLGETAAAHDTGVMFTIDEIQYLSQKHLSALVLALHLTAQEQVPVFIVGAGLPSLPALTGEARSYSERLFTFPVIDSLAPTDAKRALTVPAEGLGVEWEGAALDTIAELTAGYPYFLQEFGKQSWNAAPGPTFITHRDVDRAIPVVWDELDTGFFRARWDRLTDSERTYVIEMSAMGSGTHKSGELAGRLGKRTSQVGPTRDSLIKKGLLWSPRHNEIAFTVPEFHSFVLRTTHPSAEG